MEYVLYGIFFISCILLIAVVLLQPGKTDAGALFTSNISSSAFAPRGTATVLSKVTIAAAVTFMVSALLLSMPAITGNVSVLNSNPDTPVTSDAPTNTNTSSDANTAAGNANQGALVETPATDRIENVAANAASNSTAANANAAKPANANKPAAKK